MRRKSWIIKAAKEQMRVWGNDWSLLVDITKLFSLMEFFTVCSTCYKLQVHVLSLIDMHLHSSTSTSKCFEDCTLCICLSKCLNGCYVLHLIIIMFKLSSSRFHTCFNLLKEFPGTWSFNHRRCNGTTNPNFEVFHKSQNAFCKRYNSENTTIMSNGPSNRTIILLIHPGEHNRLHTEQLGPYFVEEHHVLNVFQNH